MTHNPIALIGGAGIVGCWAAHFLRESHPRVPLIVAGRNRERMEQAAAGIDLAMPAVIDPTSADLALGDTPVAAVATLFTDTSGAILRWAQRRGAGHVSISPAIAELGPEVSSFMHAPANAPVVLGTEWLVGATSIPAQLFSRAFRRVRTMHIGAVLDEKDDFGPAAQDDLERQIKAAPAALVRRKGAWQWLAGDQATTHIFAVDGAEMPAAAYTPNDVLSLANATGASDVRFDLALGASSTRRAGGQMSTEIIIDLSGEDHAGRPLHTRHAIIHPEGQMPVTGLGVALVLERLAGLVGDPPQPGLYFPSQLIDHETYVDRLRRAGGEIIDLEPRSAMRDRA